MDAGWAEHLQYGSAFVEVHFHPLVSDHEAKKLSSAYPKSTFFRVKAHVVFAEFPEDFFQVCHMLGYSLRLDDHVVHIYLDISSDLLFEDSVHQSLVCRTCIF